MIGRCDVCGDGPIEVRRCRVCDAMLCNSCRLRPLARLWAALVRMRQNAAKAPPEG